MATLIERHWSIGWIGLLLCLFLTEPAESADGIVRINATLFDKYVEGLQPLKFQRQGWYAVQVPSIFGPVNLPVYCPVAATISGVRMTIVPNSAVVRANITGNMCGLPYATSVVSPVAISVDAGSGGLLVRPIGAMNINTFVTLPFGMIAVPLSDINLVPALTVLSIPLDKVGIQMESPSGPRKLALVVSNHQVFLRNGFVEIQADVHLR